jgi:hypothetical protein
MEVLINKAHSFTPTPAHGPMFRLDMKLGAFIKEFSSLLPTGGTPAVLPDDLGDISVQVEIQNGQLAAQISLNIAEIKKLASSLKAPAVMK